MGKVSVVLTVLDHASRTERHDVGCKHCMCGWLQALHVWLAAGAPVCTAHADFSNGRVNLCVDYNKGAAVQ